LSYLDNYNYRKEGNYLRENCGFELIKKSQSMFRDYLIFLINEKN